MIGNLLTKLHLGVFNILGSIDPKIVAKIMYYEAHHRLPDLKHPEDLDEKINWMKFNSDTSLWSTLADKYEVRNFISQKGLGHTLNEVYGVLESPEDIDFYNLPDSFVIKTTNGSGGGQIMIVKDKSTLDTAKAKSTLHRWLTYTPPYIKAEPHYAGIKSRLLIEKLLSDSGRNSITDYKFHCFNGKVESCLVCSERVGNHAVKSIYDIDWEVRPECVVEKYKDVPLIKKPKSLDKMIEYSSILSKGFPYVRVDWYEIEGEPVFSELTFTPAGGYNKTMSMDYLKHLGSLMHLPPK